VTVREWLASRTPPPPAPLATRLEEALHDRLDDDASRLVDAAIEAAARVLAAVVARPNAGRECALDLLTADALTTYAFEAAAATKSDTLVRQASEAMTRFALVGAGGDT
jgi:hypothetical protein